MLNLWSAFKCKLCEKIFRTEADVSAHFLSTAHNAKYEEFTSSNKNYEFVRNKVTRIYKSFWASADQNSFGINDLVKTGTNAKIGARKET